MLYACFLRRRVKPKPARPAPIRARIEGSGTWTADEDVTQNAEYLVIEKETSLNGLDEQVDLGKFTIEEL